MEASMRALATAFVLLALLPAAAAAKTGISLNAPPDGLKAGEPWDVTFSYIRNDAQVTPRGVSGPSVNIVNADGSFTRSFTARLSAKGQWSARVVFPRPGTWTYSIRGFGSAVGNQMWDPVTIAPREGKPPAVATSSVGGDGSFPYGWVVAGAALVLLTGALVVRKLRS
jgi:hypothetical protein